MEGYWTKERKVHRHEFRTTQSQEEMIHRVLNENGGDLTSLIIRAVESYGKDFYYDFDRKEGR